MDKSVQREIGRGGDRTVYVESDEKVAWNYIVNTVDVIHGLGCKVVLLTGDPGKGVSTVRSRSLR